MNAEVKPLRKSPCPNCGATVLLKINKGGCVFFFCNGSYDHKACGCKMTFGPLDSEKLIAAGEGKRNERKDDGGKIGGEGEERGDTKPVAEPVVEQPAPKRRSYIL